MASSREPRATAGQAAARLGAEDGWGVASAARHWSSLHPTGAPERSVEAHGSDVDDELDDPDQQFAPDAASGEALPVKTRVRVWWPTARAWFIGKVSKVKVYDGRYIHYLKYNDNDGNHWYDLGDPQHTWELLSSSRKQAAAGAASTSAGEGPASAAPAKRARVASSSGDALHIGARGEDSDDALGEEDQLHDDDGDSSRDVAQGTRLRVWWPDVKQWYDGAVVERSRLNGRHMHTIQFDHSDVTRCYDLGDAQVVWERLKHKTPRASAEEAAARTTFVYNRAWPRERPWACGSNSPKRNERL